LSRTVNNMDKFRVYWVVFILSVAWINSSTAHVDLLGPLGGESFFPRDYYTITWDVKIVHEPIDFDLYFSPDGGETWQELASLQSDQFEFQWTIPDLETEQAQIRIIQDNVDEDYASTSENFRISKSGLVTAVEEPIGSSAEFEFLVNYPNPFQSATTIEFALHHLNHVSLKIYSVQGVKVAALMDEELSPGQYSATWDALGAKPGLYLLRVTSGSFVETRKLVKLE